MNEGQKLMKQENQLSQKDRSLFHVIKYFAKTLEVTKCHSK